GLRPVIELQSAPGPGQPDSAQMFQIVGGLLRLQNVELHVTVRSARCALFSLSQSAELKLEGVSIVVSNPDGRQAAVAEFLAAGTDMQAMMPDSMRREQVALDWSDCLIRGECDLLLLESLEPATVRLENVAAAVRGAFARVRGNIVPEGRISDDRKLSLQLRHLTALLDDGLIRVDTGFEFNREFVPIVVECDDSAIVVRPKEPLVEMIGNQEISVLQQRLRMRSSWSVFDVSGPVWEITQPLEGKREVLDFSALNMGNLIENDLLEQPVHWDEIRFPLLTEADFRLRTAAGQSNRNSSTGVQFGDRFPPADPLAASAPRDLDLP
ncbi:MAG: hypothetical protein JNG89_08780, partial [Planctomycetaceae bacterium]|nr:hypothetical protein [Planctomycetaceae bacterium]